MPTEEELDRRHAEIVAKYPGGLTPKQYRKVVLESADEDGRLYPHSLSSFFDQTSLLLGMYMDDLITRRGRHNEPGSWYITDKGREALTQMTD